MRAELEWECATHMKKQVRLGLVVAGNSTGSAILRLPTLAEELGPIKSPAPRVSSRVSHLLRAGYAVNDYEDLGAARLILLRVPDSMVPRIVDELCASELPLKDLSFALCESWLSMDVLQPLAVRGASVATLVGVPSRRRNWFVVEGQIAAVRQIRGFVERNEARAVEIRAKTKQLYFAAELLATALPVPFYMTAQQALRGSGISGKRLHDLLDEIVQEMFSELLKGGRTAWGGPLNECSPETARAYLTALHGTHPEIADVLDEQLPWAVRRMISQKRATRTRALNSGLYREAAAGR